MNRQLIRGMSVIISLLLIVLCGCGANSAVTTDSKSTESADETSAASDGQPQGKVYFSYFDTASYIYSFAGDSPELFDKRCAAASEILNEYHRLFDIYHEYSGINNLCTVNRLAGGDPVKVDKRLIEFLKYAKELYSLTDGEMNIMLGSVLKIWHEARTLALDSPEQAEVPTLEELQDAYRHTDISLLEIDEEAGTVRITDPEASIDVGALGKGYATEMVARFLEQEGAYSYVLNIGGNIRTVGSRPDGTGWSTGIKDPDDPQGALARKLNLKDTACVTSGNYERFYSVDGVRYHHIIDKDTLFPAENYASVTVITPDSSLADALSTALFCMTVEEGKALAEKLGNVEVLWIMDNGEQIATPGLESITIK